MADIDQPGYRGNMGSLWTIYTITMLAMLNACILYSFAKDSHFLLKKRHMFANSSHNFLFISRNIYRKFPFFVSAIMHVNPSSRTSCLVEEEFGWFLSEIFKLIAAINILFFTWQAILNEIKLYRVKPL